MCDTCGCGQSDQPVSMRKPGEPSSEPHRHTHVHTHAHLHDDLEHAHSHEHSHGVAIRVEQDILAKNNLLAERNRGYFEAKQMTVFNLVSSPGSGKTTLLEKTITALKNKISFYIIEGDQQTMLDADRIDKTGAPVIQINTGNGCHLDAAMISKAVQELQPSEHSMLLIENVGNLVCPSLFDLGETKRVVIMSTTEGEDKPLKYPTMFRTSHVCVINKTDLLPYVDFSPEKARAFALQVNPHLEFIEVSAKTGQGLDVWFDWLEMQLL